MSSSIIYYIVYKTTNKINGKIYIGVHKTCSLNDPYLGSGTALKNAILLYGAENFSREIISTHNSYEEALFEESTIVTSQFIKRPDVYNLIEGGGMPPNPTGRRVADTSNYSRANKERWKDLEYKEKASKSMQKPHKQLSKETKVKMSETRKGKTHTEETKRKIKESQKIEYKFTHQNYSFFGTLQEFTETFGYSKGSAITTFSRGKLYKGWVRELL